MRKPLIISPQNRSILVDFSELLRYRDLFYFLVERDIKVKYKQTVLGGLWAIIQPFFMMVVFSLFLGKFANMPSDGVPYPIFNYAALVPWIYFATAITKSGNSLIGNTSLISKVYFPRIIIPIIPVIAGLLDFTIAFGVLIGMMSWFGIYPAKMIFLFPVLVIAMMLLAAGIGMVLAALNAKYRDIERAIPFVTQFWMFASPVIYPSSMVPEHFRFWYSLNPMVGIIEGFRSILLGTVPFPTEMFFFSMLISSFLFLFGLLYFKQAEKNFADII